MKDGAGGDGEGWTDLHGDGLQGYDLRGIRVAAWCARPLRRHLWVELPSAGGMVRLGGKAPVCPGPECTGTGHVVGGALRDHSAVGAEPGEAGADSPLGWAGIEASQAWGAAGCGADTAGGLGEAAAGKGYWGIDDREGPWWQSRGMGRDDGAVDSACETASCWGAAADWC